MNKFKKILILGSGALKIGEAGEFDYSGSQAIKALKEEGIKTILINPNIATIQTSKELADEIYFLPVKPYFVEKVIAKERPDGILLSFGGQTALNCGMELYKKGILKKYNVSILGTPISAIILTEDRQKFADHLAKINISTPRSHEATNLEEAEKIANEIGFPVMVRAGFTLGGQGSGVVKNHQELESTVQNALSFSPQVLIEQYLHHYKEIEYEVVRDQYDNCITVCNMENMDPLGVHTGESIVVAPSQTLTNEEYHSLRTASINIVRSLGIVGECNVQFALNPRPHPKGGRHVGANHHSPSFEVDKTKTPDYHVIEVNARLSRSSALASKATGYPLAYIAAKLALGYKLTDLQNKVTTVTKAAFEPALDYIVVKIPRWDLEKFKGADQKLGTGMKSVGEVLGLGRTFEEAYQKACRCLDLEHEGATSERLLIEENNILTHLSTPTPKRNFILAKAIRQGISIKKIHELSGIDPWFLYRIKNIVDEEEKLKKSKNLSAANILHLKQLGFSDKKIGELVGSTGLEIRTLRKKLNILPSVLQIDTLAAEFPARTNYLYMTYNAQHNDIKETGENGVIVLGSGPYRIGSSVEFDWCSVNTVYRLKDHNKKSIIINCNPETVSTDYDISDRLYFEELTFERITDIYEFENPLGIIVSVGGQTPNNRAKALHDAGVRILGTNPNDIDRAENRSKFSSLLDDLNIKQPAWEAFSTLEDAKKFAQTVGYPVLIRPSYVLSGAAMNLCFNDQDLCVYIHEATRISQEYPVTVSKFFERAKEIELDAVAQNGRIKASVISEHIEYAGVHSGDASIVLPPQTLSIEIEEKMKAAAKNIAKVLNITGPFNIQFLLRDNEIYIIETNLRASRTFPFISKVTGINLIKIFINTLFTKDIPEIKIPKINFCAVKVPQFSFARLTGADPIVGIEMASTGEVACFGEDLEEAYLKSILSIMPKNPTTGIFISIGGDQKKQAFLKTAKLLPRLNLPIYATEKTSKFLNENNIKAKTLYKIHEKKSPNILDFFQEKKIDLVIIITDKNIKKELNDDYMIRRTAVDNNIYVMTKIKNTELFIKSYVFKGLANLQIKSWNEYS
jgi:carbamoyl-phosphate synthase large subunit